MRPPSVPFPRRSTPYSLRLRRDTYGSAVVVSVAGEVDMFTAPALDAQTRAAEAEKLLPGWVVLDLTEVSFFSCAGLTVLLACQERCAIRGSAMRLVAGGNRHVLHILRITDLDAVLDIFDTLDEAMAPAPGRSTAFPRSDIVAAEQVRSTPRPPSWAAPPLRVVTVSMTLKRVVS